MARVRDGRQEVEARDLESELDEYIEEDEIEPTWWEEFREEQYKRLPWWTISFLVHVMALLVMWKWPYRVMAQEEYLTSIAVDLVEEPREEIIEEPEPFEQEQVEEDLDVPIEDIPISPEPPSKDDPGPDLDLPPVEDMVKDVERPVPTIDPPSATPVFAVEADKKGLTRGIYSGRSRAGKSRMMGGRGGTNRHAESAVRAGLVWLAKAQERDGSWNCRRWDGGGDYSVGMTGLALLAFLGAGYTQSKGPFKSTVQKGLAWLKANQKPSGSFAWRTFYEQGIATMAVSEAYGLSRSPQVGRMAQRALDYLAGVQPDHGGFRYQGAVPKGEGDMSVTGWQVMAFKSGMCSELNVPPRCFERTRTFLKNTFREYGGSSYLVSRQDAWPAVSAIGMLCRQFVGGDYDAEIQAGANYLLSKAKPGGAGAAKNQLVGDLYYTYYSVLAMFQVGGEFWAKWNKMFRDPLVKCQIHKKFDGQGRFVRGSWDPAKHKWGARGGRVYCTAMAILCLEVYYRFLPVYKK